MNYAFELNFDELDERLQDEKIEEYISFGYDHQEYADEDGNTPDLKELLEDEEIIEKARRAISDHFPVYF